VNENTLHLYALRLELGLGLAETDFRASVVDPSYSYTQHQRQEILLKQVNLYQSV